MNVLIGFEESQAVTIAFRKRGFKAYSCDLKPCSGGHPEWHLQMDIYKALYFMNWEFIGLHPVCTKMTLSGNRHYAPGKPRHQERLDAVEWTIKVWEKACDLSEYGYMENPMGAMNTDRRLPVPQIVQPYYFGDGFQKTTCLWLHNIPFLFHAKNTDLFNDRITHVSSGEYYEWIDKNSGKIKRQPLWYANAKGFGGKQLNKDVSESRSKTFPGISEAMAEQWGEYLNNR